MASKSEDDYWFRTETKAYSFEDEPVNHDFNNTGELLVVTQSNTKTKSFLLTDVRTKNANQPESIPVPIHLIISKQDLDKLLEEVDWENAKTSVDFISVERTIKNMLLGHRYNLYGFRSLQSKTELLDTAIKSADGNCILTIILFLVKTLKKALVYELLNSRPVAVQHYASYLTVRLNISELTELSMISEHKSTLGLKLFKILVDNVTYNESSDTFLNKLHSLYNNNYKIGAPDKCDEQILKNYINLLEWQRKVHTRENMANVLDQSVNGCLSVCCQNYWGIPEGHPCSPLTLAKQQGVSERQLQWILLDVKASSQSWDDILKVFIKNNWFGNKKVINSSIHAENIVLFLGVREAPSEVLETFLSIIDDSECSISLATRFKCHRHVINAFVLQRDRLALLNYKSKIQPQCEDYFYAENVLRSMHQKWKN